MSSYIRNETLNEMPPMTEINIENSNQNIGVDVFYYPKLSIDKDTTNQNKVKTILKSKKSVPKVTFDGPGKDFLPNVGLPLMDTYPTNIYVKLK